MKEIDDISVDNVNVNGVDNKEVNEGKDTDFVNAAQAQFVLMTGMASYMKKKQQELLDLVNSDRSKFRFIGYTELKKSLDNRIKSLEDPSSSFEEIASATYELIEKTDGYMRDWSSGNEGYNGPITKAYFVVYDMNEKLNAFKIAYTNTRMMLSHTKGFGNTSLAKVMASKGDKPATKEYNFDSMCRMAEYQNEIRKNVKEVSYTFNDMYSRDGRKDSYMFIKKNPKVTDLAKYFVLSECLDKAYSPETTLASNVNDLKKVKALVTKYTTKRIEKEIDRLSKNQLFIDCIKTKGKKAFSSWAAVEKKTDKFVEEYEETIRLMGGNDIELLVEQSMGVRRLASDRLEEILNDKKAVKDFTENKPYLFPSNDKKINIMAVLMNDYIADSEVPAADEMGNVNKEVLTEATKNAEEELFNISSSTYNNVGKIVALQILTDPKNRQFLNECAIANKEPNKVLEELAEHVSEFLVSKSVFDYDLGAVGDKKCISNVKKILKDSKFKSTMLKEFQSKQLENAIEQNAHENDYAFDQASMINIAKKVKKEAGPGMGMH